MNYTLGIRCDYFLSLKDGIVEVERDRFLGIRAGEIQVISSFRPGLEKKCDRFINGENMAVLPGFVNGHTHLPMTLFRGIEDDVPLHVWLFERIFPLEAKHVDREFVRIGTQLAALECIRFGVTTVNDMYFYVDEIAEVLDQLGLRGHVCQTFLSVPTPEDKDLGSDKEKIFLELVEKYKGHPRLKIGLAPHAPYTCSDDILKKVVALSKKCGAIIHIHVNETKKEVEEHRRQYGMSPMERLDSLGVLSERSALAHCVHMDKDDRELLRRSKSAVLYNPDSNMKLGSGVAPVPAFLRDGVPVAIGTDGAASNNNLSIISAMNVGTKLQKIANADNTAMTAEQAIRSATWLGAKALGLGHLVGSLEVGKRADVVMIDLGFPHMQPLHSLVSQLVYSAQGLEVDTVVCDGKILMEKKKVAVIDEAGVMVEVEKIRKKIYHEMKNW